MTLAERLELLIQEEGSQAEFSRRTGISRSALNKVLTRNSGISSGHLAGIATTYPQLSLRWLLIGEGDMWTNNRPDSRPKETPKQTPPQDKDLLNELMLHRIRELERELKRLDPDGARGQDAIHLQDSHFWILLPLL